MVRSADVDPTSPNRQVIALPSAREEIIADDRDVIESGDAVFLVIEDEDIMNEAAVEHETAKMLIEQLENAGPDDPNYFATFTVLGEYVMHHVKEEEGEMFPQAKKAEGLDLDALGEEMRARKEELVGATEPT